MKPIGIIGYGSLGASLAHALNAAGLLSWIYIRNEEARIQAAELEVPICTSLSDIPIAHHSIILAIPDSAIKEVSDFIHAMHIGKGCYALIHCSGSLTSEILLGKDSSIATIAMHPFQTIVSCEDLPNIPWGYQCEQENAEYVVSLIQTLHGIPHELSKQAIEHKALYHATAVASANLLQMLIALTSEMAKEAGIPSEIFLPTIQSTSVKRAHTALIDGHSPLDQLTGPLIRCDVETIIANRSAIKSIPGMDEVYVAICKAIIPQLLGMKHLSEDDAITLQDALNIKVFER